MSDLWVFGYGSLMWRPGFDFAETRPARLFGWHRALCVYSWHHRGTERRPGLVLGLDRGGSCHGVAYRVSESKADEVVAYLRAREQVTRVYIEAYRPVHLLDAGSQVPAALVYLIDRTHQQYAGALSKETQLAFAADSAGVSGHNRDYVLSTADQLAELGIRDDTIAWLAEQLRLRREARGLGARDLDRRRSGRGRLGGRPDGHPLGGGEIEEENATGAGRSREEMNEGAKPRASRKLPKERRPL
jgi:cation transport protein ChaC